MGSGLIKNNFPPDGKSQPRSPQSAGLWRQKIKRMKIEYFQQFGGFNELFQMGMVLNQFNYRVLKEISFGFASAPKPDSYVSDNAICFWRLKTIKK
jgi:hypothetical protein